MNQIVGTLENDGGAFVELRLEPGNIHKLVAGEPIMVHLESFFPRGGIPPRLALIISHSETPIADARALAPVAAMAFDERAAAPAKRPHCTECRSTVEQLGVARNEKSPIALVYCPTCGCVLGPMASDAVAAVPVPAKS